MHRRQFFTAAASAVAAFQPDSTARAQSAVSAAAGRPADTVARDEDFWFNVRHAFTVDRNLINLNNGGVSPSPKVVIDTEIRYLEMENMTPTYYMWRILDPGRGDRAPPPGAVLRLRSRRDRHHAQRQRSAGDRAVRPRPESAATR